MGHFLFLIIHHITWRPRDEMVKRKKPEPAWLHTYSSGKLNLYKGPICRRGYYIKWHSVVVSPGKDSLQSVWACWMRAAPCPGVEIHSLFTLPRIHHGLNMRIIK